MGLHGLAEFGRHGEPASRLPEGFCAEVFESAKDERGVFCMELFVEKLDIALGQIGFEVPHLAAVVSVSFPYMRVGLGGVRPDNHEALQQYIDDVLNSPQIMNYVVLQEVQDVLGGEEKDLVEFFHTLISKCIEGGLMKTF